MIVTLNRSDLRARPGILDQMHRSRREVFHTRLGWSVPLRGDWEIDRYDEEANPLYVLNLQNDVLTGSLRLLETTGYTMLAREFAHTFVPPVRISDPDTWECTRFCIHPTAAEHVANAHRETASELLIGLCRLCLTQNIQAVVGVYEPKMERVYARIGWKPQELARSTASYGQLVAGRWEASQAALSAMLARCPDPTWRPCHAA